MSENLSLEEGNISESASEASEEDLQRVRESIGKAKQIRGQIITSQAHNKQFAQMLSLLLQAIDDNVLLDMVFNQLIEWKVAIPAIFAQFLPYMKHHVSIDVYQPLYGPLREHLPDQDSLEAVVWWLKRVRTASKSLAQKPIDDYIAFVVRYLWWMKFVDVWGLTQEQEQELKKSIADALV